MENNVYIADSNWIIQQFYSSLPAVLHMIESILSNFDSLIQNSLDLRPMVSLFPRCQQTIESSDSYDKRLSSINRWNGSFSNSP